MAIRGLSKDIEMAIEVTIEGLEFHIDIDTLDDDKVRNAMKAKTESFNSAKGLIHRWQNSPNAPSNETVEKYALKLIKAGESSITVLRKALRKKIDYKELEAEKHASAVSSKGVIYSAISEIDGGLAELRLQVQSRNFNLSDRDFKVGFPEKFANQEFYPLKDYYKDWYDESNGAIKICPKGTKGKLIEIDGLKIYLPKAPPKKEMINYGKKKSEQYWQREEMPQGLSVDNADSFKDFILEQFRKRREGVWFLNNGEPVYLTGNFWFALQHCKMLDNGGYMAFRYAQLELSYHTEACIIDDRALGQNFFKGRRTGYTLEKIFMLLNRVTSRKNWRTGITSKTDADAEEAFMKLAYAFRSLPFFFQPVVKGRVDSDKSFTFAKPANSSKEAKRKGTEDVELYLNSMVDYRATKESAYDSTKLNDYLSDEYLKWDRENYIAHFEQVSPTMDEGGVIVGKYWAGSTVGSRGKGGEHIDFFLPASMVTKRDPITNRTGTGLYGYFLPQYKNSRLHTDKYGVCHEVTGVNGFLNSDNTIVKSGSLDYYKARRNNAKKLGSVNYNEECRKNPLSVEDLLRDELLKALFDNEKIEDQLNFNSSINPNPVFTGNFVWENEDFGDVKFVPDPNGKFKLSWIPPKELRNKWYYKNGLKAPANSHLGAGGVDSYDLLHEAVDGRGSNGAVHFVNRPNMVGASNMFVLEYVFRPHYADIFYRDTLMAAIFFGYPLLVENNKNSIIKYFIDNGFGNYIMDRPQHLTPEGSKSVKQKGVPSNSQDIIDMHAQAIEKYIYFHVGRNDETGEMGKMYFEETLRDWQKFDIKKRTKFDASISSGYALLAIQKPSEKKRVVKEYSEEDLIRTFNNSGIRSRVN